jgi:hypothetical protein
MKTHNRAGGWLSGQTKSYPPSDGYLETRNCVKCPGFLTQPLTEIVRDKKTGVSLTRVPAWNAMLPANKRDGRFNAFSCDRCDVSASRATMWIFAATLSICATRVPFAPATSLLTISEVSSFLAALTRNPCPQPFRDLGRDFFTGCRFPN